MDPINKPNFVVDDSFPLIDGIGHSDKVDYVRVKGGGATNTTFWDSFRDEHLLRTSRSPVAVSSNVNACRADPDISPDFNGVPQVLNPGCLNAVPNNDLFYGRSSDRISASRIQVTGSITRPGGAWRYIGNQSVSGAKEFPHYSPKCFLALVLDTRTNYAVPPDNAFVENSQTGPFWFGTGAAVGGGIFSGLPVSSPWSDHRFRVLATEILDFEGPVNRSETAIHWATDEAAYPLGIADVDTIATTYSWQTLTKGFIFDVDLSGLLIRFQDFEVTGADPSISNCIDNSLHLYALCYDGVQLNDYFISSVAPYSFGYLSLSYGATLHFSDCLLPREFVPAGPDGGVVNDTDAPDLEILADESAALAGLPALPDSPISRPRKKTKASVGAYNFRPKHGGGDLFPDDPEVVALRAPGSRGADYGRLSKARRSDDYEKVYRDEEYDRVYQPQRKRFNFRNARAKKRGKY